MKVDVKREGPKSLCSVPQPHAAAVRRLLVEDGVVVAQVLQALVEFTLLACLELPIVELAIVGARRPRVVVLRFPMQPPILFGFLFLGLGPVHRREAMVVAASGVDVFPVGVEPTGLGS